MDNLKIVFLTIKLVPHQLVSIRHIINTTNDSKALVYFLKEGVEINRKGVDGNIKFIKWKSEDYINNFHYVKDFKANLIVTAGWAIKDYNKLCFKVRNEIKIPVVAYSDTQYRGNIKQLLNIYIRKYYLKKCFTHLWVAGVYQFEYAKKLGFPNDRILLNSLSADINRFKSIPEEIKKRKYPKRFLFLGRFVELKGIKLLLQAWESIEFKSNWELVFLGEGPMLTELEKYDNIKIHKQCNQDDLLDVLANSGCLILPSYFEQWSLVLHEASAAGLPIIATKDCGASPYFVMNNYNGYRINYNLHELRCAMEKIIALKEGELLKLSRNSRVLSDQVNPELLKANLMHILK